VETGVDVRGTEQAKNRFGPVHLGAVTNTDVSNSLEQRKKTKPKPKTK